MSAAEAWQEFNSQPSGEPRYEYSEQAAFMAGYRRALEDAADEVRASNKVYAYLQPASIETWLRDRAAAVAPDPRETKD